MEDIKADLARMNEKISNVDLQVKRLISHVESEQRVSTSHGRLIGAIEAEIQRVIKTMNKIDDALFDDEGLIMRLDRLEQDRDNKKDISRFNISTIISVASTLISLAVLLLMYFKSLS